MPLRQKDLFGNSITDEKFKLIKDEAEYRIYRISMRRIKSKVYSESDYDFLIQTDPTYMFWEEKLEKYRRLRDKAGIKHCFDKLWEMSKIDRLFLEVGIILLDIGEYEDAIKTLKHLYGCEGHDTLWVSGQLQMARAAALQGKKDDMIDYLTKTMKTTLFFEEGSSHNSKENLIDDIKTMKEFDNYRNLVEFKDIFKIEEAEYGTYCDLPI